VNPGVRFGILLQGGFLPGYTLESCRAYRQRYGDAPIVVSSWRDDAEKVDVEAGELARLGVEVVLSEKPVVAGSQNVNLQLVSTRAGLEALGRSGATHAMKSRTDIRIEANAAALLASVRAAYPVRSGLGQSERIVVAQSYTRVGMPYHASDMVLLGALEDLRAYFGTPLRASSEVSLAAWRLLPLHERLFSEEGIKVHAEQYICHDYLRRLGWPLAHTITGWHEVLSALFCVVDDETLGFRWYKNPGVFGAARRVDSDFLVSRVRYPEHQGFLVHSSLICRRVTSSAWLRMLEGKRPRLDAGRLEGLLALGNQLFFAKDIPWWLDGRRRRGLGP